MTLLVRFRHSKPPCPAFLASGILYVKVETYSERANTYTIPRGTQ